MKLRTVIAIGWAVLALGWSAGAISGDRHDADTQWKYRGVENVDFDHNVRHYVWETARPPYGPWDRIALHRWVRDPLNEKMIPGLPARNKRKVLFILGGTFDGGAPYRVKPVSEPYYFAAQGYDVYTIGYRTNFMPDVAYPQFDQLGMSEGLRSTANWTYAAFREDIKTAIELAKNISGAKKVFLAGRSRGGTQMYIYVAKYADDVKGIIGLDGGAPFQRANNPAQQRTEAQFRAAMDAFRAGSGGNFLGEVGGYLNNQLAGVQEFAETQVGAPLPAIGSLTFGPPPDGQMRYLRDLVAYTTYFQTPVPGRTANVYGAHPLGGTYISKEDLVNTLATLTRYWPRVQDIESSFLAGYANAPFLDYDETQHVTAPIIHVAGDFTCAGGACFNTGTPPATASTDVTLKYLPGYGHLDIYTGTHSIEEVKKVVLDWMNERL